MSSLFDDNDEQERQEQKLYEFYEVFSLEVRRQLLAKNIPIIQNVYDVLYPQTKNQLLSKNVPTDFTIDSTAESVRNALVAKLVEDNINLDTISENFRKQILSKNVLADSSRELQYKIDKVRENLLAKNKRVNPNDIDSVAKDKRRDDLGKNKEPLNRDKEIENNNISFRESNLHKNVPKENIGLDQQSDEFRKNNIHKNVDSDVNLDRQNNIFRDQNLSKNVKPQLPENNVSELDAIANEKRVIDESRNVPSQNEGLDVDSEVFRDNNLSKNTPEETSLEDISTPIRDNNLSKNDSTENDLLESSNKFRKQDLSKNVQSTSDLLSDSESIREDDLSKNVARQSDLLELSEETRLNDLSKNNPSKSDLLADSNDIRKDDLSKNSPSKGDLEIDSEGYRDDNLSNNTPKVSDIVIDNESFREDNISKNVPTESDLEKDSEHYREDIVSKNVSSDSDLLLDSSIIRSDNLSNNVATGGDLLFDSEDYRDDNLSRTIPVVTDLESLSENPREDLLSQNVPNPSDLLERGVIPREDLLSNNVPNPSDLLEMGIMPREDLLAINVPIITDLLTDSDPFRDNVLSDNVPVVTDLLNDSIPYYANNISANVPTQYDILDASAPYLDANLASNVPINSDLLSDSVQLLQNNVAPNVPSDSDLLNDSETYLQDNLASNVPNDFDLLAESLPIRNDLIASNQPNDSNLLNDSTPFRDNLLAQNDNAELGITFEGLGTFSYLGVSKVALQGLVIRTYLNSKNRPSFSDVLEDGFIPKESLLSRNDYIINKSEYDRSTAIGLTNQVNAVGRNLVAYPSTYSEEYLGGAILRQFGENRFYSESYADFLQNTYGLQDLGTKSTALGGSYFGVDTLNPQGGGFVSSDKAGKTNVFTHSYLGSITNAIRNYNLSRNLYNTKGIQSVTSMADYISKLNENNSTGFQDLIQKTIGSFHTANNSISAQQFGNLIPSSVLGDNNYTYLNHSAEKLYGRNEPSDPELKLSWIGTPESMMQKTIAGNPLQEPAFDTAERGVKHIMKTIRNNPNVKMSVNYDPQNTNKYVIKQTKTGEPVYARQRFTIGNPYSPPSAKPLTFSLKNYSSGDLVYFPPYISDFSDSHSANWNEINFLGRPEPIYTYNNSKRDGSISFFVLTDFSEIVLMGREWEKADMDKIEKPISASFFSKSKFNAAGGVDDFSGLAEQYGISREKIQEYLDFKATENTSTTIATTGQTEAQTNGESPAQGASDNQGETAQLEQEGGLLSAENLNLNAAIDSFSETLNEDFIYTIASEKNKNIYDFMTNNISRDLDGQIITNPGDTLKRLDEMITGLIFQPSYFSGSKEDFRDRMDFLAKLTKPAEASQGSGYSFTRPPVAHIKLGNWWNHDIVVKTVSVDYTDAPWALDEGRVQPLWAKVTISFDFVGRYGGEGAPVLSTDSGGVYSP